MPYHLCGLIEAAVEMFIEINLQEEGPMIINTDRITIIEYNEVLGLFEVHLDLVARIYTKKFDEESEEEELWEEEKKFNYSRIHLFPEEYEIFRKKLLAVKE